MFFKHPKISKHQNTIIESMTGDGFRTLVLPRLIASDSIVIAPKVMIHHYYEKHRAINVQGVSKFVEDGHYKKLKLIFIDCRLPRIESKAHKALLKLCKGKQIVFIQPPHDIRAVSGAMELLSVTKNPKLKAIVFSRYLFSRGKNA